MMLELSIVFWILSCEARLAAGKSSQIVSALVAALKIANHDLHT